jgi:hypothetical protein
MYFICNPLVEKRFYDITVFKFSATSSKATYDYANTFKTVTRNRKASANKFDLVNNEYIKFMVRQLFFKSLYFTTIYIYIFFLHSQLKML